MKIENYLIQLAQEYPTLRVIPSDKYLNLLRDLIKSAKRKNIDLGIADSTIRCILCRASTPSLALISKLSLIESRIWDITFDEVEYIRSERSDKPLKLIKEVSPHFLYILGALRDGSVTRHNYQIQLTQKVKEWVEITVNNMLKEVFGLKLNYHGIKKGVHRFGLNSKILYILLNFFGYFNEKYKKTPEIVKNCPFELQRYYIGGFYDAEGDKSIKSDRIGMYQSWNSEKECPPLEDIKNILLNRGIMCSVTKLNKNKNLFRLYVFKKSRENIKMFLDSIPLFHPLSLILKQHFTVAH